MNATNNSSTSLMHRLAQSLGVDQEKLKRTILLTCFSGQTPTPEEFMTLLLAAERLGLNPLTGEIFAFRGKTGIIKPLVSIDGWKSIMLRQPGYDGYEIRYSDSLINVETFKNVPEWCECTIYVKDRRPTTERVYFVEKYVASSPVWRKSPRMMLHHRAMISAIRFTFDGMSGIGDSNDAEMMWEVDPTISVPAGAATAPALAKPAPQRVDLDDEKIKLFVSLLVKKATPNQKWDMAELAIEQRLPEAKKAFALELLNAARAEQEGAQEPAPAPIQELPQDVSSSNEEEMPEAVLG